MRKANTCLERKKERRKKVIDRKCKQLFIEIKREMKRERKRKLKRERN